MNQLRRVGGCFAILEAIIYIIAFVFYGALLNFPSDGDTIQKLNFLADNQLALTLVNFMMYVLFGILLAVLVLAVHTEIKQKSPALAQLASVFGGIWVGLVIVSGMVSNIGLSSVVELSSQDPEQAMTMWLTLVTVVDGLGGGNEIVGGLWVLLLSIAALRGNCFSKGVNYLGVFIGLVGVLTTFPADVLTEIFGLGQIIWFFWLGIHLLRSHP